MILDILLCIALAALFISPFVISEFRQNRNLEKRKEKIDEQIKELNKERNKILSQNLGLSGTSSVREIEEKICDLHNRRHGLDSPYKKDWY